MGETREPTGGELSAIYDVAHKHLPPVIDIYGGTARTLKNITEPQKDYMGREVRSSDQDAFEREVPPPPGAPSYGDYTGSGPIWPAYAAARNEFHHLMGLVARNLTEASNGFNGAYNDFKGTDVENSRNVDSIPMPENFDSDTNEQPTYPKAEG